MDGLAYDDLDEFGRELDDPFIELEQDIIHMLDETFGSNPDVLTRGAGLTAALSGPSNRIPLIQSQIESQLHDDIRIASATAKITPRTEAVGSYRLALVIVVSSGEIGLDFVVDDFGVRRAS